jgi:hypothetical protein
MRLVPSAALALAAAAVFSACGTAREIEQSSRTAVCADCHGFPPAQLSGLAMAHPSDANCVSCHAMTVTASNDLLGGGAHLNGHVDVSDEGVACGACHALSPASGLHAFHLDRGVSCASCHPGYAIDPAVVNTATHLNGAFDASPITTTATFSSWPASCSDCHPTGVPPL